MSAASQIPVHRLDVCPRDTIYFLITGSVMWSPDGRIERLPPGVVVHTNHPKSDDELRALWPSDVELPKSE